MSDKPEIDSYWKDLRPLKVPLASQADLAQFVLDYCDGKVFTSLDLRGRNDLLPMVFMVIACGAFAEWKEEDVADIGVIWEYWDQAGPRSVNGFPIFYSAHYMHKDDWEKARKAIPRELDRREQSKKTILEGL
jgi:hypothetical protein